jgi:hypothetical protein
MKNDTKSKYPFFGTAKISAPIIAAKSFCNQKALQKAGP